MSDRHVDKGLYVSDILATSFTRRVDDNLFDQTAALGWTAPAGGEFPLPRTLRPRHAVGMDATGRGQSVVVADVTADLWTRATLQWNFIDGAGAAGVATLTGLVGEAVTF
jgi:hypothetical protein